MSEREVSDMEILDRIYFKIFKEATPHTNYGKLKRLAQRGVLQVGWWQKYYLDQDRQDQIVRELCDKYKCSPRETIEFLTTVTLGHSPVGEKKNWLGINPDEKAPICPECGRRMKKVPMPYIGWVCPASEIWQVQEKSRKGRK